MKSAQSPIWSLIRWPTWPRGPLHKRASCRRDMYHVRQGHENMSLGNRKGGLHAISGTAIAAFVPLLIRKLLSPQELLRWGAGKLVRLTAPCASTNYWLEYVVLLEEVQSIWVNQTVPLLTQPCADLVMAFWWSASNEKQALFVKKPSLKCCNFLCVQSLNLMQLIWFVSETIYFICSICIWMETSERHFLFNIIAVLCAVMLTITGIPTFCCTKYLQK